MASKKPSATYRLTEHAKAELDRLATLWGISAAAVLDVAIRQLAEWVRSSPPPADLADTLKLVVKEHAAEAPSGQTRAGRPRKAAQAKKGSAM